MNTSEVERTSICEIGEDNNGQQWLYRLADIENNRVVRFRFNPDAPWYFDNRNRLYLQDGPSNNGFIGVWHWQASQRENDYEKDFIRSNYIPDISPIEIVTINTAVTTEQLVKELSKGVELKVSTKQFLICCRSKSRVYTGVLCKDSQIIKDKGTVRIKNDVIKLPLFSVSYDNVLKTENHIFYEYLFLRNAEKNIIVKDINEIIREIFISRISWSSMKAAGLSKGDYKLLKEVVTGIPDNDLYSEVAEKLEITSAESKAYVNGFVENVESYIDGNDLDEELINTILEKHQGLNERLQEIAQKQWEEKNQDLINKIQEESKEWDARISKKKEELEKTLSDLEFAQEELNEIKSEQERTKALADSVETKVRERIEAAKTDAAEFIANMAFIQPSIGIKSDETNISKQTIALTGSEVTIRKGRELPSEYIEYYKSWQEALEIIETELYEAGVAKAFQKPLAAFLYASYNNHYPILLAGPNSRCIADAFSAAITGQTADVIEGDWKQSRNQFEAIANYEGIIVADGVINSTNIDYIQNMTLLKKAFMIMTCPFSEDLVMEPKGILNYVLPVFTETMVDSNAEEKYVGGKQSPEVKFQNYSSAVFRHYQDETFKLYKASPMYTKRIQRVLTDMHKMTDDNSADYDYIFGLIPFMHIIGERQALVEKTADDKRLSAAGRDAVLQMCGLNND